MVGKQGLEPRPPAPKAGALTLTLHPANLFRFWCRWRYSRATHHSGNRRTRLIALKEIPRRPGGDERTRTAGLRIAKPTLFQAELHPRGRPGPPGFGAGRRGQHFTAGLVRAYAVPTRVVRLVWCSRCAVINWRARSPVDGAPQGWQDSNLRHAVLEAAVLAAELHPYETENRPPGGSPASGSWSGPSDRGRYPVAALRIA